jgi:uncharacterized protein YecT (DUF1311 family)
MKLCLLLLLLALSTPTAALAAKDCESVGTNWAEVRACAEKQQDADLEAAFQDTLAFVKSKDKHAAALLERAQKSWREFAEASCEYTVAARLPDSNDLRFGCWQSFIDARTKVLAAYKRDFGKAPQDLMHP